MIKYISKDHRYTLDEREAFHNDLQPYAERASVYLRTCNREELYFGSGPAEERTIQHLFRVTSGLESRFIGETAIQRQVKTAYEHAASRHSLSKEYHRLFQSALRTGKRVRSETSLAASAPSYTKGVMEILKTNEAAFSQKKIILIGVNNLNRSIVKNLAKKSSLCVFIANRTYAHAQELARDFGCSAFRFDLLYEKLAEADILVCATSAPHLVIDYGPFPRGREMTIIDLAVPRDVDSRISSLPGIRIFTHTDIENALLQNQKTDIRDIISAEHIIEQEIKRFIHERTRTHIYCAQPKQRLSAAAS